MRIIFKIKIIRLNELTARNTFIDLMALIESKMYEVTDNQRRLWSCAECPYSKEKKDHVIKHVEGRHCNLQLSCFCGMVFRRRDVYRHHVKKKHSMENINVSY